MENISLYSNTGSAFIGAWYAIKLKGEELREQLYVYPKNGHQYLPLFRCRLKCPASG